MMTDSDTAAPTGTVEPWLRLHGQSYTREQSFAIFTKAEAGEPLTEQEYRVAAAWCVHPLNCNQVGHLPYVLASFMRNREARLSALQWQPIETAPKDHSRFLAFIPNARLPVQEIQWAQSYEEDTVGFWSTPYGPAGRGYTILIDAPTHWMPLPVPPDPLASPVSRELQVMEKKDHCAGLIHQPIPDMAGTEPRPNSGRTEQMK